MNKTHHDRWIIDYVSSSKETPNEKVISIQGCNAMYANKIHLLYVVANQKNYYPDKV